MTYLARGTQSTGVRAADRSSHRFLAKQTAEFPFDSGVASLPTDLLATASQQIAARGTALPEFSIVLQSIISNYICVGIAVVAARVVFGLSAEVGQGCRMGSYRLGERLGEGGMGRGPARTGLEPEPA